MDKTFKQRVLTGVVGALAVAVIAPSVMAQTGGSAGGSAGAGASVGGGAIGASVGASGNAGANSGRTGVNTPMTGGVTQPRGTGVDTTIRGGVTQPRGTGVDTTRTGGVNAGVNSNIGVSNDVTREGAYPSNGTSRGTQGMGTQGGVGGRVNTNIGPAGGSSLNNPSNP